MITDEVILALIFLISVTVVQVWAWKEKMGILNLVAFMVMLPGSIWCFATFPVIAWFIPMLFILVNAVLFARAMAKKVG
jgi:hypothetical protein